jgi:hypothetical protein
MRRSVTFTLAWLVAAGIATMAASRGVAIVADQVTDDRPPPFDAAAVQEALAAADSTTTSVPSSGSTSSSETTTSSSNPGTTTTTAETRTYNLVGGSAMLRFEPSGVTVVWANPNPGFSVEQEPEHGNGFKVEFESESHRSRVDGWWDGGPRERVRDEPDRD